jgi:predicted nucleic acid-binding protein
MAKKIAQRMGKKTSLKCMFTLDTNILIYYAAGKKEIVGFMEKNKNAIFYLPSIVIAEFLSYPLIDEETLVKFRAFVYQTIVINLDIRIAELAAGLRRKYNLKLADAIVAATAILTNSKLVTRNIHDFKKVKELEIFKV